jgi:hypothetical protein
MRLGETSSWGKLMRLNRSSSPSSCQPRGSSSKRRRRDSRGFASDRRIASAVSGCLCAPSTLESRRRRLELDPRGWQLDGEEEEEELAIGGEPEIGELRLQFRVVCALLQRLLGFGGFSTSLTSCLHTVVDRFPEREEGKRCPTLMPCKIRTTSETSSREQCTSRPDLAGHQGRAPLPLFSLVRHCLLAGEMGYSTHATASAEGPCRAGPISDRVVNPEALVVRPNRSTHWETW